MKTSNTAQPESPQQAPINFEGFDDWFPIFRAGTHTDSKGREKTWTNQHLDSVVNNHSKDENAPLVVGHPTTNDPAWGWTDGLKREGDTLFARADRVASEFEEAVKTGRYPKRSVSLIPDGNGGYKLRHIGFLGGAAPAVSGMKDLFNHSDNGTAETYEFSVNDAVTSMGWRLSSIGRVFRSLREWIISSEGVETADQIIPDYQINQLNEAEQHIQSELAESNRNFNQDDDNSEEPEMSFSQEDLDAAVAKATGEANERATKAEQELKNAQFNQRKEEAESFVENLTASAKLLPAQTEGLADFMAHLATGEETFEFTSGEGDNAETLQKSPYEFMKGLLNSLGKQITTGEDNSEDPDESASNYSAPSGYTVDPDRAALHQKAIDYSEKHGVSYDIAIQKVGKE